MEIQFLKYRKIYFVLSSLIVGASIFSILFFGLNWGIEFSGGTLLEVKYKTQRPSLTEIKKQLASLDLEELYLQPSDNDKLILRMKHITEKTHQEILKKLGGEEKIVELRFESIGPVIGSELKRKTKTLILLSLFLLLIYISFAFRRIKYPVKPFEYALAALIALFHDVLIPLGAISFLGKYYGVRFTIPIVAALLTVVGYSVNDTVVVFDRIRENLLKKIGITFEETVNKSLNQTLVRCINTSLSTLLVLGSIFFFGGESLKYFSLCLILGILAGTYSSLFLAPPLLVSWWKKREKIK